VVGVRVSRVATEAPRFKRESGGAIASPLPRHERDVYAGRVATLSRLLQNNAEWSERMLADDSAFFERLRQQ
jgi:hypothetical protein